MALEWVILSFAAGAEAAMLLLLTLPGLSRLQPLLISITRNALKPMISVVPFCIFLLMDIYWKYETQPICDGARDCTPTEFVRHQKSVMKSQRDAILIACTLLLNWLLLAVTRIVVHIDQLGQQIEKLRRQD